MKRDNNRLVEDGCEGATFADNITEDAEMEAAAERALEEVRAIMKKLEDAVAKKYGATMKDFSVAVEAGTKTGDGRIYIAAYPKNATADFGGTLNLNFLRT